MTLMLSHPFKIELSERAQKDIIEILSFTEQMWGSGQADDYENLLHKGLSHIADNPHIGHTKTGLKAGVLCFAVGRHLLFYRIDNHIIYVSRILHDSKDYVQRLGYTFHQ